MIEYKTKNVYRIIIDAVIAKNRKINKFRSVTTTIRAIVLEYCIRTRVLLEYNFWNTRTRGPSTRTRMPTYSDSSKN